MEQLKNPKLLGGKTVGEELGELGGAPCCKLRPSVPASALPPRA